MKDIQPLIAQLEAKKAKWLAINTQDIHDMITLKDNMQDTRIELKSEYKEERNEVDNNKAVRYEILKSETYEEKDKKWDIKIKNKYTDEWVKSKLKVEFQEEETKLSITSTTLEMLESKIDIVQEYTNLFKIIVK